MISVWNFAKVFLWCLLPLFSFAQIAPPNTRVSGTTFLSKQLQELQLDASRHPASLWIEQGQQIWQTQCVSCHGDMSTLKLSAVSFPKMSADQKTLINLEDQIGRCLQRSSKSITSQEKLGSEDERVLALSAALHDAAKGLQIAVEPLEPYYNNGKRIYATRMGRINLACMHCHDEKVGVNMRADVISQARPTGFPIYRMSWQTLGSIDRRLRACYSGVQAVIPPPGSPELRDLELFLMVRSNGMPIEGPSIRR